MTVRTQYEADLTALKAALVEMGQNSADAVEAALEGRQLQPLLLGPVE